MMWYNFAAPNSKLWIHRRKTSFEHCCFKCGTTTSSNTNIFCFLFECLAVQRYLSHLCLSDRTRKSCRCILAWQTVQSAWLSHWRSRSALCSSHRPGHRWTSWQARLGRLSGSLASRYLPGHPSLQSVDDHPPSLALTRVGTGRQPAQRSLTDKVAITDPSQVPKAFCYAEYLLWNRIPNQTRQWQECRKPHVMHRVRYARVCYV